MNAFLVEKATSNTVLNKCTGLLNAHFENAVIKSKSKMQCLMCLNIKSQLTITSICLTSKNSSA